MIFHMGQMCPLADDPNAGRRSGSGRWKSIVKAGTESLKARERLHCNETNAGSRDNIQ